MRVPRTGLECDGCAGAIGMVMASKLDIVRPQVNVEDVVPNNFNMYRLKVKQMKRST